MHNDAAVPLIWPSSFIGKKFVVNPYYNSHSPENIFYLLNFSKQRDFKRILAMIVQS
jgi:hypothetical protein